MSKPIAMTFFADLIVLGASLVAAPSTAQSENVRSSS